MNFYSTAVDVWKAMVCYIWVRYGLVYMHIKSHCEAKINNIACLLGLTAVVQHHRLFNTISLTISNNKPSKSCSIKGWNGIAIYSIVLILPSWFARLSIACLDCMLSSSWASLMSQTDFSFFPSPTQKKKCSVWLAWLGHPTMPPIRTCYTNDTAIGFVYSLFSLYNYSHIHRNYSLILQRILNYDLYITNLFW